GEDFERNRLVGDCGQELASELLVIGHAGLAHETRIGGEPLHLGICTQLDDTVEIGSVRKDLDLELTQSVHHCSPMLERNFKLSIFPQGTRFGAEWAERPAAPTLPPALASRQCSDRSPGRRTVYSNPPSDLQQYRCCGPPP